MRAQAAAGSLVGARSGAAAIEFALVAPLFLAFLMGIIAFESFFGYAHSLQIAASESARAAIAGLDSQERVQLATRGAQRSLAASPLLGGASVAITVGPDAADPDVFTVTLTYDLNAVLLSLAPRLLLLPHSLSRTASIRRGGL